MKSKNIKEKIDMSNTVEKSDVSVKLTRTAKTELTKFKANNEHKTLSEAIIALLDAAK